MTRRTLLLRYHEIAIKGDNRSWFEDRLALNSKKLLQRALSEEGASTEVRTQRIHGRILIETEWSLRAHEALQRVFGLSNFSPMIKIPTQKDQLLQAAVEEFDRIVREQGAPRSFRVKTRRSDKALPETSTELNSFFGSVIHNKYPQIRVDLKNPDLTVGIELRFKESFLWTEKTQGPGGLPVGTNAPSLALLSGGLDSPVAALQILRRGSPVSFLHFYGTPFVGEDALQKVKDLTKLIHRYQPDPRPLNWVPFGGIQEKIALATSPRIRTLLYRRMMVRIANAFAEKIGALALVTGESLGQVASQTLENLSVIHAVSKLPILRPLIGMDKDEIIHRAHEFGTYETSIRPAADCCTLFADRHPTLRAKPEQIEEEEKNLPIQDWVNEAVQSVQTEGS